MLTRDHRLAAVVLAGGFGTRVRHLLASLPKPLAPVCGRPFLYWVLQYLEAQGVSRAVLATHHEAAQIKAFADSPTGLRIHASCVEETVPLGTGGAFADCVLGAGGDIPLWLVINGDSLVLAPLCRMLEAMQDPDVDGVVAGVNVEDTSRFGQLKVDDRGCLSAFVEKKPGAGLINAGVYLFRKETVQGFPTKRPLSFELDIFPELIKLGSTIKVVAYDAPFIDIGTESSLREADRFVAANFSVIADIRPGL